MLIVHLEVRMNTNCVECGGPKHLIEFATQAHLCLHVTLRMLLVSVVEHTIRMFTDLYGTVLSCACLSASVDLFHHSVHWAFTQFARRAAGPIALQQKVNAV